MTPGRSGGVRSCLAKDHPAPQTTIICAARSRGHSGAFQDGTDQPSIEAIRLALPPAAVVSMQVTRSVAKRAT